MKKHSYTIIVLSLILLSCEKQSKQKKSKNIENIEIEQPKNEKLSNLELEASRLRAGGSIKNVEFDSKFAKITYVKDYEEYKELNPQSGLSKTELDAYWESGDAIEKALVDGSVRIMKKLDYIDTVSILLPYKGTNYSILVNKKDLEKFIGSDFSTIKNKWDKTFLNPFVYDDKGRKSFLKKFGSKS